MIRFRVLFLCASEAFISNASRAHGADSDDGDDDEKNEIVAGCLTRHQQHSEEFGRVRQVP